MKIATPRLWYHLRYSVDGDIILFLKSSFGVCRRPIMHEALIIPSRGVAILIHPYEIVLWQHFVHSPVYGCPLSLANIYVRWALAVSADFRAKMIMTVDIIGNDKITTSHFLLKATANRTLQNYAVANDLTPASAQNTSFLHFLHKIINTIVCLITCSKSSNKIKL